MKSNLRLRLSPEARADVRDIRRYSAQRWGTRQRDAYTAKLKQATQSLLDFPEIGSPRDHLFLGCRGLVVERHVVYYHLAGDEVVVVRVLHQSQDAAGKVHP